MITKDKRYRLSGGGEWRYYGVCVATGQVHGAWMDHWGRWIVGVWDGETNECLSNRDVIGMDLVEIKPRIHREYWVNVYAGNVKSIAYLSKESADLSGNIYRDRLACVKVVIDCAEGDGL